MVGMKFFIFTLHAFQTSQASKFTLSAGIPRAMISVWFTNKCLNLASYGGFVLNNTSLKDFNDYQNNPTFIRVTECAEARYLPVVSWVSGANCLIEFSSY